MKNFFVSYKSPLAIVTAIILLAGLVVYSQMQTSLFPEITFPKIVVIADDGLQPEDKMLITVTKPLEDALNQVPGVQLLHSITSRGSVEIQAFMDWNLNIDLANQQIESAINQIRNSLPAEVEITVKKMNPSILPVMGYVLNGDSKTSIELNQIANTIVAPFIGQVQGVSSVKNIGGKSKEYWIEMNADKMSSLGITSENILDAINNGNFISANGFVTDYKRMYLSVTNAGLSSLKDLQNLVVSFQGNRVIKLMDVAGISIHEKKEFTRINANGKPALLVGVIKEPSSNLIDITNAVKLKVDELNKNVLPKGVQLSPYYIQADFVNDSIKSVTDSLWLGLILAMVVAIIFLRSFKTSLVILITIPVTVCLSLIFIYLFGYTFNIMTIGALAASIGLIIDDAIVVVEQIHRTHEEQPKLETKQLLSGAVKYLFPAMVGSSLSTIVIFLPFSIMSGVAGSYFNVLTNTMIITLVCSFFVTWILLPVIYLLVAGKKSEATNEVSVIVKEVKQHSWISFFIKKPWISISFCVILVVCFLFVYSRLETGFLPDMDEGTIVLDYSTPPGTSLDETNSVLNQVEKMLVIIPEVQSYSRRTGTQMGFFITEPNTGDYLIQLKKDRSRTTDEVIDDIRQHIESTQPSLTVDFGQVIGDMLGDLMASVQPVEIKIYGNDKKVLQTLADSVANLVEQVNGAADVFDGNVISGPSIEIKPKYDMLAVYNITPANFQMQLQTQGEGEEAGNIFENQQQTPIRLIYPNASNQSIEEIKAMNVFQPDGKLIPLQRVADVSVNSGSSEINREDLQLMAAVTARLNNRDLGSVMKDIQHSVSMHVHLPSGYSVAYGGAYAQQQQSFKELLMILICACMLVFTVIVFLFKQIKIALLILFISILGITGGLFALYLTGTPLNVSSYTGLIMMVGIIGENAIFTFLQFNETRRNKSVEGSIVFAISTRLRPKLMTALGAIIALFPIALGIGAGAQLHQPLAITVIGGFLVALPLLLIVFPTLLNIFYNDKVK